MLFPYPYPSRPSSPFLPSLSSITGLPRSFFLTSSSPFYSLLFYSPLFFSKMSSRNPLHSFSLSRCDYLLIYFFPHLSAMPVFPWFSFAKLRYSSWFFMRFTWPSRYFLPYPFPFSALWFSFFPPDFVSTTDLTIRFFKGFLKILVSSPGRIPGSLFFIFFSVSFCFFLSYLFQCRVTGRTFYWLRDCGHVCPSPLLIPVFCSFYS